jgi:hypothetical protein
MVHVPSYLQLGTRDDSLRPVHTFAVGGIVHEDRQTVTVFVPIERAQRIVAHLEGNGRIALGIGQVSHEAYQIKGSYVSRRPTDADDIARQEARRAIDDALQHGLRTSPARSPRVRARAGDGDHVQEDAVSSRPRAGRRSRLA